MFVLDGYHELELLKVDGTMENQQLKVYN